MIGFASEQGATEQEMDNKAEYTEIIKQTTAEDVIHYGMIPEIVGRLPLISTLESLDVDTLIKIMTEPRNALIKQYQKLFEMEDTTLEFTDKALKLLAEKALERDTGARALRAITESLMVDLMYRLPEEPSPADYTITEEVVSGDADMFELADQAKKESA
jgi:ATP-dependent Clp protease ATP-binding subunit ClpX